MAGAGILFVDTESKSVLAGFHPKLNRLSGFGGKQRGEERPEQTAVREVVEELFGIFTLSEEHIDMFAGQLRASKLYSEYTLFIEPLETVFELSTFLSKNGYFSPFYTQLPISVSELLQQRILCKTTEVTELSLFALRDISDMKYMLTSEFYADLTSLSLKPAPSASTTSPV
jgi:hypothetical protein